MPSSKPWIIAHRGASRVRPENTVAAFEAAIRQGADGIEFDVQLTRDEVPVLWHDRTLARAGGGRSRVAGLDANELRRLDAAARWPGLGREPLPTLERVLARYAGRTRLWVEIKLREPGDPARHVLLARRAGALVRDAGAARSVTFLCFDRDLLDAAADAAPGARRALNLTPPARLDRRWHRAFQGLDAVSADVRTLTPAFGAALRDLGLPLVVFTCNTPHAVRRAIAAGAAGVMADRPDWLAGQLRDRGASS